MMNCLPARPARVFDAVVRQQLLSLLAAVGLSACGGSGGGGTPPDPPPVNTPVASLDCSGPDRSGWCWQEPQPGAVAMRDAQFTDADNGWAVGEAGTVLRSTDGGSNWTRRPIGATGTLLAVRFADAQTGWILGERGSWFTRDGGGSWTRAPAAPLASLGRVWVQPDGRVLVSPADGASSFSTLTFAASPQQPPWQPVPMWVGLVTQPGSGLSTWHGVIVEPQAGPRRWGRSTDGGASFMAQTQVDNGQWLLGIGTQGSPAALWAQVAEPLLDPADAMPRGYRRNQVLRSGDDGRTWGEAVELPAGETLMLTALRADGRGLAHPWAADFDGRLVETGRYMVTADGGRSWAAARSPDGEASAALADDQWLLSLRDGGGAWLSADFGGSWSAIDRLPAAPATLLGRESGVLMFRSGATGDGSGQIHRSRDRGNSWTRTPYVEAPNQTTLRQLWFFDELHGLAVRQGTTHHLLETRDGGRSWAARAYAPMPMRELQFTADGTGWAISDTSSLLRSNDRGRSWSVQPAPGSFERPVLVSMRWLDDRFGWAVVGNVVCPRSCFAAEHGLFVTEDGGSTWALRLGPTGAGAFFAVAYLSPLLALRIDSEGRLLRSVNGGRDWTIVTGSALPARLEAREALHAIDAQLAFIGQQGHLLRSADGGLSWQRIDLPLLADETGVVVPGRIHTLDSRRLLATAERDLLLTTTDGGLSWSAQRTGTGLRLGALFALDERRLWLGGSRGAILATTTGGR